MLRDSAGSKGLRLCAGSPTTRGRAAIGVESAGRREHGARGLSRKRAVHPVSMHRASITTTHRRPHQPPQQTTTKGGHHTRQHEVELPQPVPSHHAAQSHDPSLGATSPFNIAAIRTRGQVSGPPRHTRVEHAQRTEQRPLNHPTHGPNPHPTHRPSADRAGTASADRAAPTCSPPTPAACPPRHTAWPSARSGRAGGRPAPTHSCPQPPAAATRSA